MGFRSKLILLALLANLLLGGMVWQLVSGAQSIKKQMQLFVPTTSCLQKVSAIHSSLTRQTKEILNFLVSHEELDKNEFIAIDRDLEKDFKLWRQSAIERQHLGEKSNSHDLTLINETFALYQRWHKSTRKIVELADKGNWSQAQQRFRQSWETTIEQQLLPTLNQALNDGLREVEDTYHGLLLAVGMIPWGAEKNSRQLEIIHTSMDFLVGGNRLNASANTQFSELVDYLLHNNKENLQHYYHYQVISSEALSFWAQVIERKARLEEDTPDETTRRIAEISAAYQRFRQQATTAINLKKKGQTRQALELIVGRSDTLIADLHDGTSRAIREGAKALVARVSTQRMTGILLLTLFLVLSSVLSLRMMMSMLSALKTLGSGMHAIQQGDLHHRILLKKEDDMGNLAQTFNTMMDSLCQTQESLRQLTAELEQRVIERTAQLTVANNDLEAFNAMVSHDLRSPLTTIYGYSQLLLRKQQEGDYSSCAAMLENILISSEKISRIVAALETLSLASHKELIRKPVMLDELARKVFDQLATAEPQRKVDMTLHPVPLASGDPDMLEIILTNLLGNAWKYTSKMAKASIEFGSCHQNNKQVWYVRDNGAGFDMNQTEHLFKTFGRLHSSDEFAGTGIGLTTVQRIIQRHDGGIWAEAEKGQGATFYFHLGQTI